MPLPSRKFNYRRLILALIVTCASLLACAFPGHADTIYESETFSIEKITSGGAASGFGGSVNGANGLAFDTAGNLYVATFGNNNIVKFNSAGTASIFASAGLTNVQGLAFDSAGNLYAANSGNDTILKFTPAGVGSVFAVTGNGHAHPYALAFDAGGNLYASEQLDTNQINGNNYLIEKFTPNGGVGTLFADFIGFSEGLAFDGAGNLYVAQYSGNTILKFTPDGMRSTFATSDLNDPWGLAFDSSGNLCVVNFGGSIVKFTPDGASTVFANYPVVHSPTTIAIQPGLSVFVTLNAQRSGSDLILSWPTNAVGFTLQSTSSLNPPVNWIDSTNTPAVVGASFAITNSVASDSGFYRLKR